MSDNFKVEFYCRPTKLEKSAVRGKKQLNDVLRLINENDLLVEVEKGQRNIQSKFKTGSTGRSEEAMTLVQKGLALLCLFHPEGDVNWGVYGNKTIAALKKLQKEAGIQSDGQLFGKLTLEALKIALNARKNGQNWEVAVKGKSKPKAKPDSGFSFYRILGGH